MERINPNYYQERDESMFREGYVRSDDYARVLKGYRDQVQKLLERCGDAERRAGTYLNILKKIKQQHIDVSKALDLFVP